MYVFLDLFINEITKMLSRVHTETYWRMNNYTRINFKNSLIQEYALNRIQDFPYDHCVLISSHRGRTSFKTVFQVGNPDSATALSLNSSPLPTPPFLP